jgi:hypothetical protein
MIEEQFANENQPGRDIGVVQKISTQVPGWAVKSTAY